MTFLSCSNFTKNAPVKFFSLVHCTVHRWCGEIVQYLTLLLSDIMRKPILYLGRSEDICYLSGHSLVANFICQKEALISEIREVQPFISSGHCSFPSLSFLRHCFYGESVKGRVLSGIPGWMIFL